MQEKLETTLASLVAIPSESRNRGACHQIIEYVRSELEPLGLFVHVDIDRDNPYLIATTQNTKHPHYLLLAHLDVVPAHPSQYTVTSVEDRLLGRGVFDMKFAAACFIEFAKQHHETLKDQSVGFAFTTDEELGGQSVSDILAAGWRANVVFIPDGGMGWKIEERAKGFSLTEITATGKAAHASRPAEGSNAITNLLPFLADIKKRYPLKLASDPTLTISTFHAGDAWNQVPDTATVTIDFRAFEEEAIAEHLTYIEAQSKLYGFSFKTPVRSKPLLLDRTHPDVVHFIAKMEIATGNPVSFSESFGGTDGRWFAAYDIPCIIVQPNGGGHHSANEWLHRSDLTKYYQLLETWLLP
ncbi:MAG TPA: M20/M25/M40 family metallo-hydrolase [Verrucomicrobiae bacterium]|nr:M20/M25/M40 family metallo-hydrolase [Verrucomicrobiae bacterium]